MIAAVEQASELGAPLVELVIANRAHHVAERIELELAVTRAVGQRVQEVDGRLVLEERGLGGEAPT